MLHISWWFLLLGLGIYAIYFLGGLISILIMSLIDTFKFKIGPQAKKILDFFEKNNNKFVRSFIILTIICLILIPLNNLVWYIKCSNKNELIRLIKNKQFIENKNYYFYKIAGAPNNMKTSGPIIQYYTYSINSIEIIKKMNFVQINKNIYVKPFTITIITKEEFLEKTKNTLLEEEFKNE